MVKRFDTLDDDSKGTIEFILDCYSRWNIVICGNMYFQSQTFWGFDCLTTRLPYELKPLSATNNSVDSPTAAVICNLKGLKRDKHSR